MSDSSLFEKGRKVRKEVLGEDYVNRSIAGADDLTRTMAEWSIDFCWGSLWTWVGLDRRTRSMINFAMLGALGRPHELKLHVMGALKNGLTKDEIKEILLQVAVYCGIPSGIYAFRNAREAFNEVEAKNVIGRSGGACAPPTPGDAGRTPRLPVVTRHGRSIGRAGGALSTNPRDFELHYTDWGNASAPPLLLIYGGLDHSRSWDDVARALCSDFHVVAPDLRGHGDSGWATGRVTAWPITSTT